MPDIYKNLNIQVYPEDIITTFPDPSFGIGSRITIIRATPLTIIDAGAAMFYRTQKETIAELLKEKEIVVYPQDILSPALETPLADGMKITITRVAELDITQNVEIPYKTIKQDDSTLDKGKTAVKVKGISGIKEQIFHIRRENGKEVSRKLISEKIISQPQNGLVMVGTKIIYLAKGIASYMGGYSGFVAAFNGVPNGTKLLVTNFDNGKSIVVTRFSSGPFVPGRVIDLSLDAFNQIKGRNSGLIYNVGVSLAN